MTKFELCIPAYNESSIIAETVTSLVSILDSRADWEWQITVADNGSTDDTRKKVEALRHPRVRVRSIAEKGKGGAIISVARESAADIFGFVDADLSADPCSILPFVAEIERGEKDALIGSRLLEPSQVSRGKLRKFLSWCFNTLRKILLDIEVKDSQCPLKIMNTRGTAVLASCTEKTWFFDLEFLARLRRHGLSFSEVPIAWEEERYAGRKTKIRFVRDALGAVAALFRIRKACVAQKPVIAQNEVTVPRGAATWN